MNIQELEETVMTVVNSGGRNIYRFTFGDDTVTELFSVNSYGAAIVTYSERDSLPIVLAVSENLEEVKKHYPYLRWDLWQATGNPWASSAVVELTC